MKTICLSLLLACTLLLAACGQKASNPAAPEAAGKQTLQGGGDAATTATTSVAPADAPAAASKEVSVYMYSEYISPELIEKFEKESGLKVRLSVYEATEEMLAKMQQAGGANQYDVVVVSDHAIPVLAKLNLIQPLDPAKIPNKKNISPRFAAPPYDPQGQYSIPYQWGTMGIIYRKDKIAQIDPTWALLFDPTRQPGPFVLIDSLRDMMAAALKQEGQSINSRNPEELRRAGEMILAAKKSKNCLGFEGGTGGKNKVAAGQAALAIVYNGDAVRAMAEDPGLGFILPREGTLIWVDAMTIPAQAPNPAGAHQFINFILDPQNGAALSDFNQYATPNEASLPLVKVEDRQNPAIYPSQEEIARMEYLEDVGADTRLYDEVWTAVKSR